MWVTGPSPLISHSSESWHCSCSCRMHSLRILRHRRMITKTHFYKLKITFDNVNNIVFVCCTINVTQKSFQSNQFKQDELSHFDFIRQSAKGPFTNQMALLGPFPTTSTRLFLDFIKLALENNHIFKFSPKIHCTTFEQFKSSTIGYRILSLVSNGRHTHVQLSDNRHIALSSPAPKRTKTLHG